MAEQEPELSVNDMRLWLQQQRDDMNALLARRFAEAEAIVEDYASGKATWQQIEKRMTEHIHRWSYMNPPPERAAGRLRPRERER